MPTPTPSYYVRAEAKREREADKLLKANDGDAWRAADVAWARMEAATEGGRANYWGAVCLVLQRRAEALRA